MPTREQVALEQILAIRDEANWWSEDAAADRAQGRDGSYARGQASGLRRALRMLGIEEGS